MLPTFNNKGSYFPEPEHIEDRVSYYDDEQQALKLHCNNEINNEQLVVDFEQSSVENNFVPSSPAPSTQPLGPSNYHQKEQFDKTKCLTTSSVHLRFAKHENEFNNNNKKFAKRTNTTKQLSTTTTTPGEQIINCELQQVNNYYYNTKFINENNKADDDDGRIVLIENCQPKTKQTKQHVGLSTFSDADDSDNDEVLGLLPIKTNLKPVYPNYKLTDNSKYCCSSKGMSLASDASPTVPGKFFPFAIKCK